ncbi:hypothetical protein G8C92_12390 [Paenibacillus donghaensis]|uniref:hypothetical protein n=1 Tax=Paenibacillus donghaensis TaxID=414771 RepID=UPI001883ED6F|nr:hypothetical protein [Paenibacillus donghaensis]MBE9914833.1 hypothetical protein [Paenibacillus donghaensis]
MLANGIIDCVVGLVTVKFFSIRSKWISSVNANSSSMVTPKNTDDLGSNCIPGIVRLFSHLDIAWEKLEEIIALLESEWKITEGKTVDLYKEEIENLKTLLKK